MGKKDSVLKEQLAASHVIHQKHVRITKVKHLECTTTHAINLEEVKEKWGGEGWVGEQNLSHYSYM